MTWANGFAQCQSLPLMREVASPQGEDGERETTPQSLAQSANDSSPDKGSLGRRKHRWEKLGF